MKRAILALTVVAAVAAVAVTTTAAKQQPKAQLQSRVERGKYLVTIAVCNDCHTPFKMGPNGPEPDFSRQLSGHPAQLKADVAPELPKNGPWVWAGAGTNTAFAGPWGISYAANLTPDRNTGIGIWTEDMFIKTLRTGRHWGVARPILPPMPWPWFRQMTDEDLRSIYAYLRTIKPVNNQVPDAVIAGQPKS